MWMGLTVGGNAHATGHPRFRGAYSGAQTMAREIVLAPKGSPTGLLFRPLLEVATLHSDAGANRTLHLTPNAVTTLTPNDGLHCRVIAAIAMPAAGSAASVNLRLRAFPVTAVNGAGDLNVTVVQTASGERWVELGSAAWQTKPTALRANLTAGTPNVKLEAFIDGPLSEVFANDGEGALSHGGNVQYTSGSDLQLMADMPTSVQLSVWSMEKAIKTDDDDDDSIATEE